MCLYTRRPCLRLLLTQMGFMTWPSDNMVERKCSLPLVAKVCGYSPAVTLVNNVDIFIVNVPSSSQGIFKNKSRDIRNGLGHLLVSLSIFEKLPTNYSIGRTHNNTPPPHCRMCLWNMAPWEPCAPKNAANTKCTDDLIWNKIKKSRAILFQSITANWN